MIAYYVTLAFVWYLLCGFIAAVVMLHAAWPAFMERLLGSLDLLDLVISALLMWPMYLVNANRDDGPWRG